MSYQPARLFRGLSITIVLAIGTAAILASTARADVINLNPCNGAPLSQPFARWLDPASYELAPGGDFEQSNSWALSGDAHRVQGSDPYAATGSLGSWSLDLPAGSSAQSSTTCVDAAYPSVRLFIGGTGSVAVSMVVGNLEIPAGVAIAGSRWTPSPVMLTTSAVAATLSGGVAQVSLRIRALTGDPRIDDVYIDPWCRG